MAIIEDILLGLNVDRILQSTMDHMLITQKSTDKRKIVVISFTIV